MSPGLEQGMDMKMHPFMIDGIEVLEQMNVGERSAEAYYRNSFRPHVLKPPYDKATFLTASGASGVGKGKFLEGMYRVLMRDKYLRRKLREHGVGLTVLPVPFTLYPHILKLPRFVGTSYAIPSHLGNGQFTPEQYRNSAVVEWRDMQEHIISRQYQGQAIVALPEFNLTSYPVFDGERHYFPDEPVEVVGEDRCNSPAFTLALDDRTKDNVFFTYIEADDSITAHAGDWRSRLDPEMKDPGEMFNGEDVIVYSRNHDGKQIEVEVASLEPQAQRVVIQFLKKISAPPAAMERIHKMQEDLKARLQEEQRVSRLTSRTLYEYSAYVLAVQHMARIVRNQHFLKGRRTYDLDFFLQSLQAQIYPEFFTEIREVLAIENRTT